MKESNTQDFDKTRKTFGKPLILELTLRGGALILAVSNIISASVCLNKLSLSLTSDTSFYLVLVSILSSLNSQLIPNTRAAAGWTLFLSLLVLFYQIFAILQLFFYLKMLYIKIPLGKSLWYLFPLIDIVVNIVCIIGYLPAAIAAAVYAHQWMEPALKSLQQVDSQYYAKYSSALQPYINNYVLPIAFTSIFAFGSTVRCVAMIIFIILAKIKFKWPNYFVPDN